MTRREFLAAGACCAAAVTRLRARTPARVRLAVPTQATGPRMPLDFIGLSYEVQQLTDPAFFSAANGGLIRAFRSLSPAGVLRLGGNTSEFAYWKPTPDTPEPEHPPTREVVGEPKAQYYAVTPEAVRNLADFLRAAGWSCIYGINMGTNTPARAAEEAAFAAATIGDRLQYFQIGNEADLFGAHLRDPATWSAKMYLDEWLRLARAIAARVPSARFGLPDVAGDVSWLASVADAWQAVANPPRVTTLTHHYYFGGPPSNPDVTIANLLKPATVAGVRRTADIAAAAAGRMGLGVRMTEGNTCYRGGKPGVSDVFAAALWAADYALLLATNGYTGINLHGGSGPSVANSVGGFLPGDDLLKAQGNTPEQIAAHPHPFYSPVATFGSTYVLEPVAYGLEFAGRLCGGTLLKGDWSTPLQSSGVNATAYGAKLPSGRTAVIVLNKDAAKEIEVTLDFGAAARGPLAIERLHAPALDSREAHITTAGRKIPLTHGRCSVRVPRATALCATTA
jgi:hypothetical protein